MPRSRHFPRESPGKDQLRSGSWKAASASQQRHAISETFPLHIKPKVAVGRAENAARELVVAVKQATGAGGDCFTAAYAMHTLIRGNNAYFSPMIAGPISVERLEAGLLAAFRSLLLTTIGRRDFGGVDFSNATSDDPSPATSWTTLEKAAMAPARKYFVAEAPAADREAA